MAKGIALNVAKQPRCPKYETIAPKVQAKTAALRCVQAQRRGIMAEIGAVGVIGVLCPDAVIFLDVKILRPTPWPI